MCNALELTERERNVANRALETREKRSNKTSRTRRET
jgi:hypothetical protein